LPDTCDAIVIDCVLMNAVPTLLQHPHLFGHNRVFAAGMLISIVGDENPHGLYRERFRTLMLPGSIVAPDTSLGRGLCGRNSAQQNIHLQRADKKK
jgi:hypothetical protein